MLRFGPTNCYLRTLPQHLISSGEIAGRGRSPKSLPTPVLKMKIDVVTPAWYNIHEKEVIL